MRALLTDREIAEEWYEGHRTMPHIVDALGRAGMLTPRQIEIEDRACMPPLAVLRDRVDAAARAFNRFMAESEA